MKKGTIVAALVMGSMCFGHAAFSQETPTPQTETQQAQGPQEFSDAELESFIKANTSATEIQKASRDSIVAALEEENLTLERFNELAKAHRQKQLEEVAEGPDEIASFSSAAQQIVKIQPETKEKTQQAIEEEGLTVERYEAIMKAYQEDPAVQAKVRQLVAND
ncbi:MAG: DUF4168 domain-containing protein [Hymenobacteraceae bacterium]|nr:DUF4168 domain-containing protein [Hymenobacteraceae bacterium]MDX5482157.1 DUF4168 domain-containing protein [Hymenobacteraceae bacterium]